MWGFYEPDPAEREKAVWAHIGQAFSEPMTRRDDSADYVPTQIIAELFKREGFDGNRGVRATSATVPILQYSTLTRPNS